MLPRIGLAISAVFRRTAPDPFVLAVLLTLLTAALALTIGFPSAPGAPALSTSEKLTRLIDAWGGVNPPGGGIWSLLAFGMQMCIVLVTGHAVAASAPVRTALRKLAALPAGAASGAALVAFAACATAVVNWGLGLIVGAILAREVGRAMHERGVRVHYPLLVAAGYTGLMVWHGGLSGSAPLSMTTIQNASRALNPAFVESIAPALTSTGVAPAAATDSLVALSRTTFSAMNIVITLGLVIIIPLTAALLAPRRAEDQQPIDAFPEARAALLAERSAAQEAPPTTSGPVPDWLERSPLIVWLFAAIVIWSIVRFSAVRGGLDTVGLDQVNAAMLALGLILHGSARSYLAAIDEGARGCGGIIIQFPLYAGIMVMMRESGLIGVIADAMVSLADARTAPLFSFFSAAVINLFVPSGGGQWAVQGPIALQAGFTVGADPARMILSVAYGDQLSNMLQPFWALPLLAITGVKARDIVGYTALIMLIGGMWISLMLLLL